MKQSLNLANHFAMLLMALAFLACGNNVQKDVSSWPQMSVDKFGCMMEETFGYRHEIFNCSLKGYENNPDPCSNEFHDGFPFPDNLVKKVHPSLSRIDLFWQQGKLQRIYLEFKGHLTANNEEQLKPLGLWDNGQIYQPYNIKVMNVGGGSLTLIGFGETKCSRGDTPKAGEDEAMLKAKADCPNKKIGSPKTVEAVFLKFSNEDSEEGYEEFGCYAYFRLSNGEEIILDCGDTDINVRDGLKKGIKVSITYQKMQRWNQDYFNPSESMCIQDDALQSVKLLPNGNETPHEIQYGESLTYEGQTYKTVIIGKQTWMAENLNYNAEGSKCYDNNEANCKKYGRLYNWATAMKACPNGWHLPSKEEWESLDFGDSKTAGKKLKAASGWEDYREQNGNGEDKYGFAALPGGYFGTDGFFNEIGFFSIWYSASEEDSNNAYFRNMNNEEESAYWGSYGGKSGLFSVRCVKD